MTAPPTKARICRMCGHDLVQRRGSSREHVIPAWLQRDFGLTRQKLSYTPTEADSIFAPLQLSRPNEVTPHRAHSFGTLLLGSVCKMCNDGWMSALETRARSDLTHLIRGDGHAVGDPDAVALWALKTAYTLTLATDPPVGRVLPGHGNWPATHQTNVPPGANVLLHRSDRDGWWFSSVGTYDVAVVGTSDDRRALDIARAGQRNAYCYLLHFGRVLLVARYWPDNRSLLTYDSSRLELLSAGTEVRDEPSNLPRLDYDPLLELVFSMRTTLNLAHRGPSDFCLCGSGAPAADCAARRHAVDSAGNWGWIS